MTIEDMIGCDGHVPAEPLSCTGFEACLSAYLDGEVEPALAAALERHRDDCGACARVERDLRAIIQGAAALPPLTPSRDLWAGVEARITAPAATATGPTRPPGAWGSARLAGAGRVRTYGYGMAAAAVLALAVSAGTAYRLLLRPAATVAASSSQLETPVPTAGVPHGGVTRTGDVAAAYVTEIAELRGQFDARRAVLDSSTIRVLETNMAIIDRAIRESRAALAADPANTFLNQQLSDVMGEKLELMRTAVMLTSGA